MAAIQLQQTKKESHDFHVCSKFSLFLFILQQHMRIHQAGASSTAKQNLHKNRHNGSALVIEYSIRQKYCHY